MAKLLVVDDEEHIRFLYSEELSDEGYEVSVADGGYKLLERIEEEKPDLVVLDIKMMDYNGLDLLQDIRNVYYDLPVILCTAYDTFKEDMKSIAADFYVIKSFDLQELKHKIKMAIDPKFPPSYTDKKPVKIINESDIQSAILRHIDYVIDKKLGIDCATFNSDEAHEICKTETISIYQNLRSNNFVLSISPADIYDTLNHRINLHMQELKDAIDICQKFSQKAAGPDRHGSDEIYLEDLYIETLPWETITINKFIEVWRSVELKDR